MRLHPHVHGEPQQIALISSRNQRRGGERSSKTHHGRQILPPRGDYGDGDGIGTASPRSSPVGGGVVVLSRPAVAPRSSPVQAEMDDGDGDGGPPPPRWRHIVVVLHDDDVLLPPPPRGGEVVVVFLPDPFERRIRHRHGRRRRRRRRGGGRRRKGPSPLRTVPRGYTPRLPHAPAPVQVRRYRRTQRPMPRGDALPLLRVPRPRRRVRRALRIGHGRPRPAAIIGSPWPWPWPRSSDRSRTAPSARWRW